MTAGEAGQVATLAVLAGIAGSVIHRRVIRWRFDRQVAAAQARWEAQHGADPSHTTPGELIRTDAALAALDEHDDHGDAGGVPHPAAPAYWRTPVRTMDPL